MTIQPRNGNGDWKHPTAMQAVPAKYRRSSRYFFKKFGDQLLAISCKLEREKPDPIFLQIESGCSSDDGRNDARSVVIQIIAQ